MVINFESRDAELKGYWRDIAKLGGWWDGTGPDIGINNASLKILFQFTPTQSGELDYRAAVSFRASIKASNPIAHWIMNICRSRWDNEIRNGIVQGVASAINTPNMKNQIINSLVSLIRYKAGINRNQPIIKWEFNNSKIAVTYY